MAHSYVAMYTHLVFSTKNRTHFLVNPSIRKELDAHMTTFLKNRSCECITINGMPDHVHILYNQASLQSLSGLVRDMKRATTKWIRNKGDGYRSFAWQEGYSAFSVSHNIVNSVRSYIDNQEEHHKIKTFEEEYVDFLNQQGIKYDERFVLG